MNYIGSKFSLLGEIRAMLRRQGVSSGSFCDLFSGTTVVAQMARMDGFRVIANDQQAYSYVFQQAFLRAAGYSDFKRLHQELPALANHPARPSATFGLGPEPGARADAMRRVLAYLEGLPPREGPFFHAYCEGGDAGRGYFSHENGARCEAIRDTLESWREAGWVDEPEFYALLASLLETMDLLANTASVYGAYLKHVKATARQPLLLRVPRLLDQPGEHEACQEDAGALVKRLAARGPIDVLYLDPPYNHRQYHANYHVLETLARWDLSSFTPQGKTGLREGTSQRSRFCSRKHVAAAFGELVAAADVKHLLVSYNEEGLLPEADLVALLRDKAQGGPCEFHKIPYKRFRADLDSEGRKYKGDEVNEFLFYARVASVPGRVVTGGV